eukprot:scaffold554_cov112-Isochrysis_galbana.AAC.1
MVTSTTNRRNPYATSSEEDVPTDGCHLVAPRVRASSSLSASLNLCMLDPALAVSCCRACASVGVPCQHGLAQLQHTAGKHRFH